MKGLFSGGMHLEFPQNVMHQSQESGKGAWEVGEKTVFPSLTVPTPYFVISPDALPINLLFCFPQSSQDYFGDPKQERLFMSVYCSYQKFDYLRCPVG